MPSWRGARCTAIRRGAPPDIGATATPWKTRTHDSRIRPAAGCRIVGLCATAAVINSAEFETFRRGCDHLNAFASMLAASVLVQWWDVASKKTLNVRIDGDLVDAIARAREIEARLENLGRSGHGYPKVGHEALLDRYLDDLRRRADAGQIAVSTVERYEAALEHYRDFVCQPAQRKAFPYPAGANRDFQLAVAADLEQLAVARNGHPHARRRPLRSPQLVLDAVRAMFAWAADPARGNLLPIEFRNPFQQPDRRRRSQVIDPFGQPDITTPMTVDLLGLATPFNSRCLRRSPCSGCGPLNPSSFFVSKSTRTGSESPVIRSSAF